MKKWIAKAIVQKSISFLPFSHRVNYFFQKYVTRGVNLTDDYFYDRLGHASEHLSYYRKFSGRPAPSTCLEIGTGWYPIVPIRFFLAGADTIYSIDITFHTSKEKIQTTIRKMLEAIRLGRLNDGHPILRERLEILENLVANEKSLPLEKLLDALHITYLIEDARKIPLPDHSVDLVNSNNTFEHIYPELLEPILLEFKRVVSRQNGVWSHFIDMSDHFAHFDRSISIYHFLQYSDWQWQFIDNSIQPQNRLRIDDYREIYRKLGIPVDAESIRPGNPEELKQVKLAPRFAQKDPAAVAVSHCHFVSVFREAL